MEEFALRGVWKGAGLRLGGFFLKGGKGSLSPSREDALDGRYLPLLRGPKGIIPF